MPESCAVQQEEKENKEQQVPAELKPVFNQKVHDKCFLKF
jgi:hypothetical protein